MSALMKDFSPHIVYMTLAAWRTGKTLLHCDESLFRILGETRQTDALSGEMLRRLPFWGFWLDFPADTVFAEGQGALMGAFFTLADHDNQTDALLALTLAQDPLFREHIPMGMEYLALTDPVSTAISQQEEGICGFWRAVLALLGDQRQEASKSINASSPGQAGADVCGRPGRFRAQAGTASAGSQYLRGQPLHAHQRLRPHVRKAHWQTHSGGGEKYAAEMEAIANRQWQGRRLSGSGREVYERN